MVEEKKMFNDIEGLNLRNFVTTLLHSWKLVVIFAAIGGILAAVIFLLVKPTYTATSMIAISYDPDSFQTSPLYLVQNDEIMNAVIETIGIKSNELPEMDFSVDKTDKTAISISATSKNPRLAVETANAWADTAINWFKISILELNSEMESARIKLDEANNALATYLSNNNLTSLTWVEMVAITGAGDSSNIAIMESSRPLPNLTMKQRNEITKLIRDKNIAQWYYSETTKAALSKSYKSNQSFLVLRKSSRAAENFLLGGVLLIPVGILLGFFIAIVVVLIRDWWQSTPSSINKE